MFNDSDFVAVVKNFLAPVILAFWVIIIIGGVGISSCKNSCRQTHNSTSVVAQNGKNVQKGEVNKNEVDITYVVVKIDSCEYIMYEHKFDEEGGMIHKENCSNPEHNTN